MEVNRAQGHRLIVMAARTAGRSHQVLTRVMPSPGWVSG